MLTPAGYTYCYRCIRKRIQDTGTCPISGRPLREAQLEVNELAVSMIEQIEVYPAKRSGRHWVPVTDRTKRTVTFGLRRLYKNSYFRLAKRRRGSGVGGRNAAGRLTRANYDVYELVTYLVIVSLVLYGILRTEFLGYQLRQARVPLLVLLSVPISLLIVYTLIEMVINGFASDDDDDDTDDDEDA